ncbi:MAG: hypothetical protein AB1429_03905 [Pseudomonadota bacterium]|jgi:hypothetical protein
MMRIFAKKREEVALQSFAEGFRDGLAAVVFPASAHRESFARYSPSQAAARVAFTAAKIEARRVSIARANRSALAGGRPLAAASKNKIV